VRARSEVPSQSMRYGLGFWLHASGASVVLEGMDVGVSFRSVADYAPPRRATRRLMTSRLGVLRARCSGMNSNAKGGGMYIGGGVIAAIIIIILLICLLYKFSHCRCGYRGTDSHHWRQLCSA
jgi:hypothetical protein